MPTKINDPSSFFTNIQLQKTNKSVQESLQKIATGLRINKAADDASGLVISDALDSQLRGIGQSIQNATNDIAIAQIGDSALGEASKILQDVRVKALQAGSDSQSLQSRQALQADISRSLSSLNDIFQNTSFGGQKLLDTNFLNSVFTEGQASSSPTGDTTSSLNLRTNLNVAQDSATTYEAVVAQSSQLGAGSNLQAGSTLGFDLGSADLGGNITTTQEASLAAGSTLGTGSVLAAGSDIGGNVSLAADVTTTDATTLTTGSVLTNGSVLAEGTQVTTSFTANGVDYAAGTILASDVTLDADLTLTDNLNVTEGSTLAANSTIATGSTVGADVTTQGTTTLTLNTDLAADSVIQDNAGTLLRAGSELGGEVTLANDVAIERDFTLAIGSTIAAGSELANGSSIGGPVALAQPETLAGDFTLAAGSKLAAGTEIEAGTVLANDIRGVGGQIFKAGEVLQNNVITEGTNYLGNAQTLRAGSLLTAGSEFAAAPAPATAAEGQTGGDTGAVLNASLSEINVTTAEGAQSAVALIDLALQNINTQRAEIGSRQNQLSSTIENLRNNFVNVSSARSSIVDVDLAEELINFNKVQVLNKAQAFAAAQTGQINKKSMMDLLQG